MKLTDEERTNSQVLMLNKKFEQLRKQFAELQTGLNTAQQLLDEITGVDKPVPVIKNKKRLTNKDLYNKFLIS